MVDPVLYPYLKLEALTVDNITLTPSYFDRWQIIYTPVPEAALNPIDGYYLSLDADSIQEGDDFRFAMAIKNISPYDMDSLLVHYWIEDAYHVKNYLTYSRQDSLKSGEILLDTITIPTSSYPGANYLWIEANILRVAKQREQDLANLLALEQKNAVEQQPWLTLEIQTILERNAGLWGDAITQDLDGGNAVG